MKFKKEDLRRVIQEELQSVLKEQTSFDPGMSMARQTPARLEDLAVGKPMKIKGKRRNPLLIKVQRELIRLGAFDSNSMEPIKADGMAGPITATALSAVLPGFQCIGRKSRAVGCVHSVKFLKNSALLRTALAALSKKKPFSKDQMVAATTKALRNQKDVVDVTANQVIAQITNPIETKPTASPTPQKPAEKELRALLDDPKLRASELIKKFKRFL
tara:strand:+ start:234 stop:881 length:648 start_codon:yes stop_codon:yes gene_type:complete